MCYYSFVVYFESKKCDASSFFLFFSHPFIPRQFPSPYISPSLEFSDQPLTCPGHFRFPASANALFFSPASFPLSVSNTSSFQIFISSPASFIQPELTTSTPHYWVFLFPLTVLYNRTWHICHGGRVGQSGGDSLDVIINTLTSS